ncbi:MAG: hypothetical protein AAFO29_22280 [Actinomycetota bacterium]
MDDTVSYSLYLENDLNRVFTDAVPDLAATELRIVADRILPGSIGPIERIDQGRSNLLRFTATAGAAADVAPLAAMLSASAALFRHHPQVTTPASPATADRPDLLEALPLEESLTYGTDLATTQRYRGKTNERLTRAMLNVALATAGIDPRQPDGVLLDPLCGRGTTLNWALAYGLDAIGIDVDRTSVDQHRIFIETWAKRQRLPHKATVHRPGNAEYRWLSMTLAPDRATLKADRGQRLQTFLGDGADRDIPIRAKAADVIVGDLPYGVQHQGSGGDKDTVAPAELLARALPTWRRWLRPGGAICLAWNLKQADRATVSRALVEAGFEPVVAAGGYTMRHVVDATIDRDVIVAGRP